MDLINFEFGTTQLSGNLALYKRLLGRFSTDYKHTREKLAEFVQLNNLQEMQLLVHTIKGVSGNLGLDRLHNSAVALDASLKSSKMDPLLVEKLNLDIAHTLAEIDLKCNQDSDTDSMSPPNGLSEKQLIEDLRHQRFIADDKLETFFQSCNLSQALQHELKSAIDQLDYELALQLLENK